MGAGSGERGAKSAVLGFALSCRTQTGGNLPFDAPQVEHLFKTAERRDWENSKSYLKSATPKRTLS
jgi:hypothetical protein